MGEHKKNAVNVIDDRGNELVGVKSLDDAESEQSSAGSGDEEGRT